MKITPNSFFDGDFYKINLNVYLSNGGFKDCQKPEVAQRLINKLGRLTWGGYGENRKDIFQNSYLAKTGNFYHLGVDINVPKGTPVKAPFDCEVLQAWPDPDTDIGWGGRVILKASDWLPLLVLGHLHPKKLPFCRAYKQGEVLGEVGTWPLNGNTFEHLHVQCIKHNKFDKFDGYGSLAQLRHNPDPMEVDF
jgi:hypothetical protein